MKDKTYKIKGMHCASCAGIIEKTLKKTEGVFNISVNYGNESLKISYDEEITNLNEISNKIKSLGYSLIFDGDTKLTKIDDKLIEISDLKNKLLIAIPIAIFSILIMTYDILFKYNLVKEMNIILEESVHHLMPILASYIVFIIGKPYILGIYRFFRYGKANMDTLIGIGSITAFIYSFLVGAFEDTLLKNFPNLNVSYFDVTIIVITFITLGKYLEIKSKLKTGDAISKLLNLQAKNALVIRNDIEIEIPINEVIHGDIIIIKPGGKIPVDGIVVEGDSYIDESMLTGESMPVYKVINDIVSAGTINTIGSINIKATKVGEETLLAHIIKMVEEAQGSKAPIQKLADKISSIFVPIVLILSIITFLLWIFLGGYVLGYSLALSYGILCFVSILIIACPCALGLATPTAIIVGVGKGAKEGILVKDALTLENLHKVDTIVFDKTGTITKGKPEVVEINNLDKELISILASLENKSEHPIAHAILDYAKKEKIELKEVNNFEIIKGKGLKGVVDGLEYFVGNISMINDLNLSFDIKQLEKYTTKGKTPLILAVKNEVLGFALVSDLIKDEAINVIKNIHKLGIKTILLTGDNKQTAEYIREQVGINIVIAEVMPQDKFNVIKSLKEEGKIVAMVGDGINDAPALVEANVGIAMANGNDIAIESASIIILNGDISKIIKAIKLSKITMRGIKQNLFWAFIYNIIGIPLAGGLFYPFFGVILNPAFAGFAMALSSVSVVSNSLRIKNKKI